MIFCYTFLYLYLGIFQIFIYVGECAIIQVLCADWWKGDSVVSGGVDCKLCISSDIGVV